MLAGEDDPQFECYLENFKQRGLLRNIIIGVRNCGHAFHKLLEQQAYYIINHFVEVVHGGLTSFTVVRTV